MSESIVDQLTAIEPDWADVLRRLGKDRGSGSVRPVGRRRLPRRRTVLLAIALAAVIAPLAALAANRWWFLGSSVLPRPAHTPIVVTQGSWYGHPWTLAAYPSKGYGLCWGITFAGHTPHPDRFMRSTSPGLAFHEAADGFGCGGVVGLRHWNPAELPTVEYESETSYGSGYPSWIAGAVVTSATHVVVRWPAVKPLPGLLGSPPETERAATFPVAVADYRVRLFAVPVPKLLTRFTRKAYAQSEPGSISGTNQHGRVVACYAAPALSSNGVYLLSDCKP